MNINNTLIIMNEAEILLENMPSKPFFCLPMSAVFYALLKDNHHIDAKIVTGNLSYKDDFIFKQDFSLSASDHGKFKLWAGHAWVEIEGTIWDLSFFRTLYSDKFRKPYKEELLKKWGPKQEMIITDTPEISDKDMRYHPVDTLSDEMATWIIKGISQMP